MAINLTATTMWARLAMTSLSSAHIWSIAMVRRRSTPTTHSVARLADRWRIPIHTLTVAKTRNISTKLTHAGAVLIGADILLSGEIKPSHLINGAMLGVSTTGVGTIIAGVWFIADYGTMGINYIFTREAQGISDMIDESIGTYELYEGFY